MIHVSKLRYQLGMTLIELMIAGVISILIAYFIGNIMISTNKASANNGGSSEAQESARFITSWLQEEVRRAGYSTATSGITIQPFAGVCADPNIIPPAADAGCTYDSSAAGIINDRIAVQWIYDDSSPVARDTQDCTGAALTVANGTSIVDVYWIENLGANNGYDDVLRCVSYNADSDTVIGNVQSVATGIVGLQALYGESIADDPDGFKNVTRYVNAAQVENWENVQAIRISVLTRSFNDFGEIDNDRSYVLLDGDPYTFNDRTTRYMQTLTIALPNK
jgi:type IV pilus assembly protein PilW